MTQTWKDVWEARRLDPALDSLLARLMAADGLDTGFGNVGEAAWRRYVAETTAILGIAPPCTVFEVGCGAGAYLLEPYQAGCSVEGLDASTTLIRYAGQAIPGGRWQVADAADLDGATRCDFVIASAVFLYFPTLAYARTVLERMVKKARRGVMVLDVPDLATREQALAFRRGFTGEEEYGRKYEGLDHLYFDRRWFETALTGLGYSRVRIDDQRIEGYGNAAYRFNVFAWPARS